MSGIMDTVLSESRDTSHPYYHFEPWDVKERPQWMYDLAREDGIDLNSERMLRHAGKAPHPFQTGYFMDTGFFRTAMAGTQTGKTQSPKIELPMALTGILPVAFMFEFGEDTGVERLVTRENVSRFGRIDNKGEVIDHDDSNIHERGTGSGRWNCGNIMGVGHYPTEKIAPYGETAWIGSFEKAVKKTWLPFYYDGPNQGIPEALIDRNRGHKGFNRNDMVIYLVNGAEIGIITYESGYERFEAEKVWMIDLDEEPKVEEIFISAQTHCRFLSLTETPYQGITFTEEVAFPKEMSKDRSLFHCTQYDSPYQDRAHIDMLRKGMSPWQRGARIWGIPTEIQGQPFYDRIKINQWYGKYQMPFKWRSFFPTSQHFGVISRSDITTVPGAMDVPVKSNEHEGDNLMDRWRVYEDVQVGMPYVLTVDPAEGAERPEDAGDCCAAMMCRPMDANKGDFRPKIVATLRSTLQNAPFTKTCLYAMRYYNNAVLGAESKRGSANAAFANELKDYPYWYMFTSIQDSNQKTRQQPGFDTNAATRGAMFKMIEKWIGEHSEEEYPEIPDKPLLKELEAMIKGKDGRPDHPRKGTDDTAMCFAIQLYIFENSFDQVRYNGPPPPKSRRHARYASEARAQDVCNLTHLGYKWSKTNGPT